MASKMTQKRDELEFAKNVGVSFVKQFYTSMATEGLDSLGKFYGEDSMLSFNGEVVARGTGVSGAYGKIGFNDAQFDLESGTFDFAPSHDEGLIIIVNGFVVLAGKKAAFTQTFFLAPLRRDGVASSYFVRNDIVRLSENQVIKASENGEVAAQEEKKPVREVEAVKEIVKETVQEAQPNNEKKVAAKKTSRAEKKEPAPTTTPVVPPVTTSSNAAKPNTNVINNNNSSNNNRKRASKPQKREKVEKKDEKVEKKEEKEKVSSWASIVSKREEPEEEVVQKEKVQRSRPNSRNSFQKYPNCLFVKEIEKDVTQQQLGELFETYGKVKTVEIIRDRKYAFVTFENPEGVKSALSADKIMLKEKALVVQERTSQTSGRSFGRGSRFRNRKTNGKQNGFPTSANTIANTSGNISGNANNSETNMPIPPSNSNNTSTTTTAKSVTE